MLLFNFKDTLKIQCEEYQSGPDCEEYVDENGDYIYQQLETTDKVIINLELRNSYQLTCWLKVQCMQLGFFGKH